MVCRSLIMGMLIMFSLFPSAKAENNVRSHSAYDFTFKRLTGGEPLALEEFKNHVMLVVNTASKCGFTGQYEGLQTLYETYKDQGLVIVGVPANDFGGQEPGSEKDIAGFCQLNYGVTFPMTSKTVVSGDNAHPFYKWIKKELGFASAPKWNFHKYLIGRDGTPIDFYMSTTAPDSSKLRKAIEQALSSSLDGDE